MFSVCFFYHFLNSYCCFTIKRFLFFNCLCSPDSYTFMFLFSLYFSIFSIYLDQKHVNKVYATEAEPLHTLSTFEDHLTNLSTHSERSGGAVWAQSLVPGRIFKRKHIVDSVRRRTGLCAEWSRALLQWPPFSFWFQARRRVALQCNLPVPILTSSSRTSSWPWTM